MVTTGYPICTVHVSITSFTVLPTRVPSSCNDSTGREVLKALEEIEDLPDRSEEGPQVVLVGIAQGVRVQVVGNAPVERAHPQKVCHHPDH